MRNAKLGTAIELVAPETWIIRAGSEIRKIRTVGTAPFARTIELPNLNETAEQRNWIKEALTSEMAEEMITLTIIETEKKDLSEPE